MRIFSLATDEAVAVGDNILIKVLEISDDEVQLGIERWDGTSADSGWEEEVLDFDTVL